MSDKKELTKQEAESKKCLETIFGTWGAVMSGKEKPDAYDKLSDFICDDIVTSNSLLDKMGIKDHSWNGKKEYMENIKAKFVPGAKGTVQALDLKFMVEVNYCGPIITIKNEASGIKRGSKEYKPEGGITWHQVWVFKGGKLWKHIDIEDEKHEAGYKELWA
eukprot:jgi/Bigna1/80986/fgenesh1_pg.76_\